MTTGCFSERWMYSPTRRAMISDVPPAWYGTMMWMGFVGNCWAGAVPATAPSAANRPAARTLRRVACMLFLSEIGDGFDFDQRFRARERAHFHQRRGGKIAGEELAARAPHFGVVL